jgi:hypothetical protein
MRIPLSLGKSQTGLAASLSAQLVDEHDSAQGGPITTGFTELGNGLYAWYYDFADDFDGGVVFTLTTGETSVVVGTASIAPDPIELAIKAKTDLIVGGTGQVTVNVPVTTGGDIAVILGDAYLAADGRAFTWNEPAAGVWPDLSEGATFYIRNSNFSKALSVISATSPKAVQLELAGTDLAQFEPGTYELHCRTNNLAASGEPPDVITFIQANCKLSWP